MKKECDKSGPEVILTEGTLALLALTEPLPNALSMELALTSATWQSRQTASAWMHNVVTNRTLIHSLERGAQIPLPFENRVQNVPIFVV